jgi:hypothetical protein
MTALISSCPAECAALVQPGARRLGGLVQLIAGCVTGVVPRADTAALCRASTAGLAVPHCYRVMCRQAVPAGRTEPDAGGICGWWRLARARRAGVGRGGHGQPPDFTGEPPARSWISWSGTSRVCAGKPGPHHPTPARAAGQRSAVSGPAGGVVSALSRASRTRVAKPATATPAELTPVPPGACDRRRHTPARTTPRSHK